MTLMTEAIDLLDFAPASPVTYLPVSEIDLDAALKKHFGYPHFRPGQRDALTKVLSGRDTLVVMPTGAGKSLVYQLAALLRPGVAVVISPLIALMKDQVDGMKRRGIAATFINSSLSLDEQRARTNDAAEGEYKLVLVSPERLRSRSFREAMQRATVSLLAVDEAHCLSQWGHDFRPDYMYIAEARTALAAQTTLALTATATPKVQDDMLQRLGIPDAARLVMGFNRPNLSFEARYAPGQDAKLRELKRFLADAGTDGGGGIIYAGTRKEAEQVAEFCRDLCGLNALHYHAGIQGAERSRIQDAFLSGDLPIVVATNAFGMGIDRPDVRWVLHYNLPSTIEAYYQEAGRAGRDERPARAMLLYGPRDVQLQEFFIDQGTPDRDALQRVHAHVLSNPGATAFDAIATRLGLADVTQARVALEQLAAARLVAVDVVSAGGNIRVEAKPMADDALDGIVSAAMARARYKSQLLAQMVNYAETRACRRRVMLSYFGDAGTPDVIDDVFCCDNCTRAEAAAPPPVGERKGLAEMNQSERAALIVLDTVGSLPYSIGAANIARVLSGSESEKVVNFKDNRNYGKFTTLRLPEIEALVQQLFESGHLNVSGGARPTVKLTDIGRVALREKHAIRLEGLPQAIKERSVRVQRQLKEGSDTVTVTQQLHERGLTPEQIAGERQLAPGTIYSHLAQLIALKRTTVSQVVPVETISMVMAAIEQTGSAKLLSPIKSLLPQDIDWGVIRCVAEDWKLTHPEG